MCGVPEAYAELASGRWAGCEKNTRTRRTEIGRKEPSEAGAIGRCGQEGGLNKGLHHAPPRIRVGGCGGWSPEMLKSVVGRPRVPEARWSSHRVASEAPVVRVVIPGGEDTISFLKYNQGTGFYSRLG